MLKKFAFIAFLIAVASGCAVNPVTGERELTLVSDQQAINIGTQQYGPAQQMQGGAMAADTALQGYVDAVGQRVAAASGVDLPYEFVVLNNSTPNAWALPGGKIAINRGLLALLQNEAELAAVLGHEVAHAAARHGAKRMERGIFTQGALVVAGIGLSNTQYGNQVVGLAAQGAQLLNLRYSRNAEREADFYGMDFMIAAGYDPYASVTLQEKFLRLAGDQPAGPSLFASHPPSAERVQNNRQKVEQLRAAGQRGGEFKQAAYAQATRSIRQHAEAYEAYDEANALLANDAFDAAAAAAGRAISAYSAEPLFHGLRGGIRLQQGRAADAVTNLDRAIAADPNYFLHLLYRGSAHAKLGKVDAAEQDLKRSVALLPTTAGYMGLGQIAEGRGDEAAAKGYYEAAGKSSGAAGEAARARYVALDIDDQPARYVGTQVRLNDAGRPVLRVANLTSLALKNIQVQVQVRTAAGVVSDSVRVASLEASEQVGIRLQAQGDLIDAQARAVTAELQ
ncbi:MAG: M48 family metalloprotease [Pseudomonadota bacterium]